MDPLQARATSQRLQLAPAAQQTVYSLMQSTARQMLALPSINSSPIADLPGHIATLKSDAQWFISNFSAQITTWVGTLDTFGVALTTAANKALAILQVGDATTVAQAQQTEPPRVCPRLQLPNRMETL